MPRYDYVDRLLIENWTLSQARRAFAECSHTDRCRILDGIGQRRATFKYEHRAPYIRALHFVHARQNEIEFGES
jgi:hypothetical protein